MRPKFLMLLAMVPVAIGAPPSFLFPISIPLGGQITSLVSGDFNGDGRADIAVTFGTSGFALFLGNADGTLTRRELTNRPAAVVITKFLSAVDVNDDHKLDLVGNCGNVEPFGIGSIGICTLFGNGDGTFQSPVFFDPRIYPILPLADFNGDRFPDLIGSQADGSLAIEFGNGDGTFRPPGPGLEHTGDAPFLDAAFADVNNDGFMDIAAIGEFGSVSHLWLGNGDGTFRVSPGVFEVPMAATGYSPFVIGDVNGDGKPDVVVQATSIYGHNVMQVDLGAGDGTFLSKSTFPYPPYELLLRASGPLALADFDGDGKTDIASYSLIYPGNGDGTFQPPVAFGQMPGLARTNSYLSGNPLGLTADINGDGKPDFIGESPTLDTLNILINSSGTPVASAPAYLAPDGDPNLAPGAIATLFGTGLSSTTLTATTPSPTTLGNVSVELVDYSGKTFLVPLLYVSPTQINFLVPPDAAIGQAIINILGTGRPKGAHSTMILPVSAGFFTLDGSGHGAPVASAVRVAADGTQTPLAANQPLALDATSQVYLSLYGTGFRNAASGSCTVGNAPVKPSYFGPQSNSSVVDQVNLLMPANTPKGPVNIACQFRSVANQLSPDFGISNTVSVAVQ